MLKDQRGVVHLLVLLILLAGIGVGVYLVQTGNLKLFSKATNPPIVFKSSTGQALPTNSSGIPQTTSSTIKIELTSTLGTPVTTPPTPSYETPSYETPSTYGTPSYSYPTPTTPSPTPTAMRVFVTSTTYTGNLGGLSGADAKCQARANAASLGGTWKAWLSDSRTSASSRLNHYNGPYKDLQNSILVSNWTDLVDGSGGPRINVNEFKSTKTGYAWTNTNFKGDLVATTNTIGGANGHCADWISTTPTITGGVGSIENTSFNTQWTGITVISCTQEASLYCFEQTGSSVQGVTAGSYLTPTGGVSGPITTGTVSYRFAESPTDLDQATYQAYTQEPTVLDYTFKDSALGSKFIWVDFKDSTGKTDRKSAQIDLVTPSPSPSPSPSLQPDLSITKIEVLGKARVKGKNSINVTVQNTGGDIAKGDRKTQIKISLTITQPDGKTLGSCDGQFNNLNKNGTTRVQVRNCPAFKVSGNHTITATVDSTNVVSESNETNNQFSITVSVNK